MKKCLFSLMAILVASTSVHAATFANPWGRGGDGRGDGRDRPEWPQRPDGGYGRGDGRDDGRDGGRDDGRGDGRDGRRDDGRGDFSRQR